MAIIKKDKDFEPHPPTDGPIRAVVADVTDAKLKDTKFGQKKQFAIIFETELKRDDGTPWTYWEHGYTESIHEKASLRRDALKILGVNELGDAFDTESLIGQPVKLIVEHKKDGEKTYANMTYLSRDKSDSPLKISQGFIRQRDKQQDGAGDKGASYNKAESGATAPAKEDWQKCKVHVGQFAGQQVENLDTEALQKLIDNWLPKATAADNKPTADDKRLIAALTEAKALLAGAKDDF